MTTPDFSSRDSVQKAVYKATPLSLAQGQVRLLLLQPGPYGAPVSCSLFRTDLRSAPAYEALSYTWGTFNRDPAFITLNKQSFPVTHNLHDALQDLRLRLRVSVLWIDALCINQDDLTERSEQVRQMTLIYQQASRVLVWLGPSVSQDLRVAVDFLQQWPTSSLVATDQGKTIHKVDQLAGNEKDTHPYMTDVQLRGILQILQRPWFSRGWVVQEVTAAKQAVCGCGPLDSDDSAWFSWSTLLETGGHFMRAMINHHEGDVIEFGLATTQIGTMRDLREATLQQGLLRLKFEDCIRMCQNFTTTDPRDRIYALLGLAGDSGNLGLTPDYTESPRDLFVRTTRLVCRAGRSLDLLTLEMDPKLDFLPSWAKDFSSSFTPLASSGGVFVTLTDLRYNASSGSAPLPRRSGTDLPHQMHLSGKRIGVIKYSIPINLKLSIIDDTNAEKKCYGLNNAHEADSASPVPFHFHLAVENFEELYNHLSIDIFEDDDRAILENDPSLLRVQLIRHLWLILSGGRSSLGGEDVSLGNDCQFGIWKGCESDSSYTYSLGYGVNLNTISAYPHRFRQLKAYFERQTSAFVAPYRASQGRNFFVTEEGHLGLCPRATKAGDLVSVVYGASVPFILRLKEGEGIICDLIGGSYAHGFMDGEAMQSSFPNQEYVLE